MPYQKKKNKPTKNSIEHPSPYPEIVLRNVRRTKCNGINIRNKVK